MEPADAEYRSRFDVLAQQVAGKHVIHVGCVDHGPAGIRKKMQRGRWLHQTLSAVAERCFGVDLDEEGIAYMREQLGYTDVAVVDVAEQDCPPLMAQRWDYLLLPEVLEHIGDPVQFLEALRRRFCDRVAEMVITVPNAFARRNFRLARRGIERINSDHRFWFTPYTLTKVVMDAGLEPHRISLCSRGPIKPRALISNACARRYPLLRNSIVMTTGLGVQEARQER